MKLCESPRNQRRHPRSHGQCGPIISTICWNNLELKEGNPGTRRHLAIPKYPVTLGGSRQYYPGFEVAYSAQVRGHKDRYRRRGCEKNIRHPNWYSSLSLIKKWWKLKLKTQPCISLSKHTQESASIDVTAMWATTADNENLDIYSIDGMESKKSEAKEGKPS